MSDFDINCAVAESEGVCWYSTPSNSPSGGWEYCNIDRLMINQDSELLDYCNDASAAWPIIMSNFISIDQHHNGSLIRVWGYGDNGLISMQCLRKDILRAAMIVFLIMIRKGK
ncbi:MAG: phage protein NinX family protein [Plesiomonas shigelloides]